MRTICFLSVATHLGGGERSLLSLVMGLKQERAQLGYDPWVILPRAEGPLISELQKHGIAFDVLEMPEGFFKMSRANAIGSILRAMRSVPEMWFYMARLVALIRKRKAVLVHTNGLKCQVLASLLRPMIAVPVVWHLRDIVSDGATLRSLRLLQCLSGARLLANSTATARSFYPDKNGVQVVYNGLEPEIYFPNRNRIFNEKMAVSVNTPMIGILGVLTRWKGQLEFLKMAKELIRRGSDAMFVVIGGEIYDTGADRGYGLELKIEAERLGIVNRIYFTGFEADPARMINGLDVLVHASIKPEPFGRVILEAMACGVPVAASAAGGVLEFVKNDATGRLFSPGNTVEMADAVEVLTKNAVIRDALIKRARDQFLLKFTTAHHARAVARYYDGIISE